MSQFPGLSVTDGDQVHDTSGDQNQGAGMINYSDLSHNYDTDSDAQPRNMQVDEKTTSSTPPQRSFQENTSCYYQADNRLASIQAPVLRNPAIMHCVPVTYFPF